MSETSPLDLNGAVQNAWRSASNSVSKTANGRLSGESLPQSVAHAPMRGAVPLSIISAHTELTGSITTTDELHVFGKIQGDVRAATITVCAGGTVHGDLTGETVVIEGTVEGRIEAQHVLLRAGAVVTGEIMHGSLGIDTAAMFEGTIKRIVVAAAIAAE
jgi:cytoskeletal protein CcmA (bactofilin family)